MGQLCHFLKLMMKGQSCLTDSGQQLKSLSGNHTVSLIFSSLTFKKLSCLEIFFKLLSGEVVSSLSLKSIEAEAAQDTQAAVLGAQSIPESGREHETLQGGYWGGWTGREGSLSPPEPHPRGPVNRDGGGY